MKKEIRYPFFVQQTNAAFDFFKQWHKSDANENIFKEGEPFLESPYCRIHEAFDDYHKKKANNPDLHVHNCIGCNLTGTANEIYYFLKTNRDCEYVGYYIKNFTLSLYTHVENLAVIYKELGYTNNRGDFDWTSFPTLQMIKSWANFFKHPKSFMFLHHPTYHLETDPDCPNFMISEIIDTNFVMGFYRAGADNVELFNRISNKENCKVFFPDLVKTTQMLCLEFEKIINLISSNEDYLEKLSSYTTVERQSVLEEDI